jgi:hypothetical protein
MEHSQKLQRKWNVANTALEQNQADGLDYQ